MMATKFLNPTESTHSDTAEEIVMHLQQSASRYFSELEGGDVHITLMNQWRRENSRLYRFMLQSNGHRRFAFVKVPSARGQLRGNDRPYLIPETDPTRKFQLHVEGLKTIDRQLGHMDSERFGTVRLLDWIPDSGALVMEEVQGRTLRQWLNEGHRLRPTSSPILDHALGNAGVWLRAFHSIAVSDGVQTVHERRDDFAAAVVKFATFLESRLNDRSFMRSVVSQTLEAAETVLPDRLPLGLRFGDFGLTNILVASSGKITPIDTMACWRAPIYEDLAWLLTALKAYKLQVATQGLAFSRARIGQLEEAFLAGYFGSDPVPRAEIALYEVMRLLERWAAKAARFDQRKARFGMLGSALTNRFFRRRIRASIEHARAV